MTTRKSAILSTIAFLLILGVPHSTWATNLVVNGDFSTNTGLGQLGSVTTAARLDQQLIEQLSISS